MATDRIAQFADFSDVLAPRYDVIVCVAGSSGSVIASRLAENTTYWHETGTAKMGRDPMSVVDGHLNVYGFDNLRVADASIMPRITSGNTMAPCVVIGERAAQFIKAERRF